MRDQNEGIQPTLAADAENHAAEERPTEVRPRWHG
jgi:hypothetical protein